MALATKVRPRLFVKAKADEAARFYVGVGIAIRIENGMNENDFVALEGTGARSPTARSAS